MEQQFSLISTNPVDLGEGWERIGFELRPIWAGVTALPIASCVASETLHNLQELQLLHLYGRDDESCLRSGCKNTKVIQMPRVLTDGIPATDLVSA